MYKSGRALMSKRCLLVLSLYSRPNARNTLVEQSPVVDWGIEGAAYTRLKW